MFFFETLRVMAPGESIVRTLGRSGMGYAAGMSELTFRDFAGAVMGNDLPRAGDVLKELLALDEEHAKAAAAHFHAHMTAAGPAFMGKAMGLRTAVTGGTGEEVSALLGECFGLTGESLPRAVAELRRRYPAIKG